MKPNGNKNSSTGVIHWGELAPRETHKQEVITPDIIDNIWRQVIDDSSTNDCDYQNEQSEFLLLPMDNPHVLNTVQLHSQLRSIDDGKIYNGISEIDEKQYKDNKLPNNPFHFLSPKTTDKIKMKKVKTIHHLRSSSSRSLLKHSVIVLSAHVGYDKSSDIAIETLTDVADYFLKRITLLLKIASEQKEHGFPDAMERVLVETGVGGVVKIHDYYRNYVLRYEEKIKKQVEKMIEQQQQLELSTSVKMELDEAVSKLQFEELDEFGNDYKDVPTLQLLDPDMSFPPSLNAGFQMLHSLEQDE
ncbi:hypothetical protein HCN44_002158 [Aphidius gifuensis]|uniref:STAGA complex 65 subunit gamma n=1 Tax=Aphidius gifuensis TaxID=684658 RepID=A0A834Y4T5_APHGI|nr:STAGA complex 65 subunit gamma-like [Aphidius gifuensis]KAF7996526.1 hypothetical protein HCN44_002158 [Aphidius gifuensis]